MDQKTSIVLRNFAQKQIETLQLLVESIDDNEMLRGQVAQSDVLIQQYSEDAEHAKARIEEDQATIQIKDGQLKVAEEQIAKLNDLVDRTNARVNELTAESERKSATCKTYENAIESLNNQILDLNKQVKAYEDKAETERPPYRVASAKKEK